MSDKPKTRSARRAWERANANTAKRPSRPTVDQILADVGVDAGKAAEALKGETRKTLIEKLEGIADNG